MAHTKICTKCKNEFPATEEFFYKLIHGKFNLVSQCKKCMTQCSRNWDKENKDKLKKYRKNYYKNNKNKYRLTQNQKEELSARRKEYRINNPTYKDKECFTKDRRNQTLKRYNTTEKEVTELLKRQGGVCAICRKVETRKRKYDGKIFDFCIDHCHETSKVRGLLCSKCNAMIGQCKNNPEILLSGIKYLRKNN